MSSSVFSPITLTGVSQYSSDYQSILNRAVQIGQLPITALQNKDVDLLQKKTLLGTLSSAVGDLSSSLQALGTVAASQAVAATSSDPTAVSVTNSGATSAASYTINSITSTATSASERALNPVADSAATPVSANGSLELVVGSKKYDFSLTSNNLVNLRDQINAQGAGVTASILTTATGNYLSVASNSSGATTLQLVDDPNGAKTQLLTATNQGTDAVFQLNGINVTQKGNVVNSIIPGVTFTLLNSSTTPVTLSLNTDRTQVESALRTVVTNYNALQNQLRAQVGAGGGQLSGDIAVTQLESLMRQLTNYGTSSGSIHNLSDLGVTLGSNGQATFNSSAFDTLSGSQVSDAFKFLGSATTGFAGLGASFRQFSDPISGLLRVEQAGLSTTDQSIQDQIATLTDRLSTMQSNLAAQLQKADAAEAALQSQQTNLNANILGLNYVLYGKQVNS